MIPISMASSDSLVRKLCLLLNSGEITNYTEEDVSTNIFVKSDTRLKILVNLMSQVSEDYKEDLKKAPAVEWELIRQIRSLQYSRGSNSVTFVMAECSKQEQKEVFENIIRGLECINLALSEDNKCASLDKNGTLNDQERSDGNGDLRGDNICKRVQEAMQLCHKYEHLLSEECTDQEVDKTLYLNQTALAGQQVDELCNSVTRVANTMSKLPLRQISEQHIEPSSDFAKLEQNLETVKDVISNSVNEDLNVEIINPSIFLAKIRTFRERSKLLNMDID